MQKALSEPDKLSLIRGLCTVFLMEAEIQMEARYRRLFCVSGSLWCCRFLSSFKNDALLPSKANFSTIKLKDLVLWFNSINWKEQ